MVKPRPYQSDISQRAADILRKRGLVYLAMEVRTGKTMTAFWTFQNMGYNECLFVTKKKAIASIEADAKSIGFNATVVNYESLHKVTQRFKCVVVDEAHAVGTYPKPSQRFKELRKHIDQNTKLILLSGTPSPESYSQLYHQFALHPLGPFHAHKNFYRWADTFVTKGQKYVGAGMPIGDYSNAKWPLIKKFVSEYIISYTQSEAGFTQSIHEHVHIIQMRPTTYAIAKAIIDQGIYEGKTDTVLADSGVKVQSKLHQIYSGTVIGENDRHIIDRSKGVYIRETFKDRKIAIFTKFQSELEMLLDMFPVVTSSPEAFNSDPEAVFIGQIQSSREGVNLSTADCLIYITPDFSALSYLQGRDRASHIGRSTPPEVHWIFANGGIEAEIYERVRNKEDYTNAHFKNDRGKLSSEADRHIQEARLARSQADESQRSGIPRSTAIAP